MFKQLKILWSLWLLLLAIGTAGTLMVHIINYPQTYDIYLKKGAEVRFWTLKPYPHDFEFNIRFTRNISEDQRSEPFKSPGEPILISVKIDDKNTLYQASPSGVLRTMYPYVDEGDPTKFSLDPMKVKVFNAQIPAGIARITVTIEQVGKILEGEKVQMEFYKPVGFKFSHPDYLGFSLLTLYPFYFFILAILGIVLCFISKLKQYMCGLRKP